MELDFDNDEFESFLKQKADQYKMYPSERVWKGIAFVQHSRTRLITIGGSLLVISIFFFFGGRFLIDRDTTGSRQLPEPTKVITRLSSAIASTQLPVSPENARRSVVIATSVAHRNEVIEAKTETAVKGKTSITPVRSGAVISKSHDAIAQKDFRKVMSGEVQSSLITAEIAARSSEKSQTRERDDQVYVTTGAEKEKGDQSSITISGSKVADRPQVIDEDQASDKAVNWLQEIAAIKLAVPKRNLFNVQFYFSPMVSYRKLVDNTGLKTSTMGGSILTSGTVGRFVDHKPAIGVELGSNVLYSPIKNLTIKTGVQLNYSRYTIKAYKSHVEKASIALNSTAQHTRDTMVSYTTVRNFNGYSPEVLENQYLQVSIPVGAELILLGKKKLQFSVAGTVQPTYLIFNDSYLLSTDYEHYTKEPSLIRKWNLHTSAEAFVSYKIGSLRWQVGPQFRYQLLSSYQDRYPIKEYLMEYGVKFGLSKTLK